MEEQLSQVHHLKREDGVSTSAFRQSVAGPCQPAAPNLWPPPGHAFFSSPCRSKPPVTVTTDAAHCPGARPCQVLRSNPPRWGGSHLQGENHPAQPQLQHAQVELDSGARFQKPHPTPCPTLLPQGDVTLIKMSDSSEGLYFIASFMFSL